MLKTTISSQVLAANEVLSARMFAANEVGDVGDSDRLSDGLKYVESKTKRSESQELAKSQKLFKSSKFKGKISKKLSKIENSPTFDAKDSGSSFLTPEARLAFNCLPLAFTKALILWHFDPKSHIRIKTDILGYAIGSILSQLAFGTSLDGIATKTDLGQWHPVAFFSRKIIPAETWYKTHNGKLLAILEAFKTWCHYLEGWKYEIFVLTDHNNLCCFIDTKNLSSKQVCWAQEFSRYHFQIDYCQGKANTAANTLSRFSQRS